MAYESNDLRTFGPFGRYNEMVTVTSATIDFSGTGSAGGMGAAAFIVTDGATGTITLAKGAGTMDVADLIDGQLYEIGVASVTESGGNPIYVLKR